MASVGHLLSGLAQDLKSPLQGVIGNTELMLASTDPGRLRGGAHEIRDNAARAADIVRNLIAFTETGASPDAGSTSTTSSGAPSSDAAASSGRLACAFNSCAPIGSR